MIRLFTLTLVILCLTTNLFAACEKDEFQVPDAKDPKKAGILCAKVSEDFYKIAKEDMPKKGPDLEIEKYITARNAKASDACKTGLTEKKVAYKTARNAFIDLFGPVQGKPAAKKALAPAEKTALDKAESTMQQARREYLDYEFQCGNCYVRVSKRWNTKINKLPLYYQTEGACLTSTAKKNWVENGLKYFGQIKNYAKNTDFGLTSIDAYRVLAVNEKKEIKDVDFDPAVAPEKQFSYTTEKDSGKHYAFISVQGPKDFNQSLGYPYLGVTSYKKTGDLEIGRVSFDTFFDQEIRDEAANHQPATTRCTASGSCKNVKFENIVNALGSWDFTYDTKVGSISYFTAGDFGNIYSLLGLLTEKSVLFPHAIRTVMETVWEAKERLEDGKI